MHRRDFLKATGLSLAGASLLGSVGAAGASTQGHALNVVLYVVDDQGSTDAGCYGNPVIKTPGLDRLAGAGTRFTNAYATCATCSASRSVILSGMYNHANGQYGHAHSYHHFTSFEAVQSLPALLKQRGYRTCCAGKYHVAPESVYPFDEFMKVLAPKQMAEACRPLVAAETSAPFFLYFCTTEPHRPFKREGSAAVRPEEVIVPPYLPETPECREELAEYYGSVERADSGLNALIDLLVETGHWEDTLILYVSDNGIAFPGAKTTVYEPGIKLPCVLRHPGQQRVGGRCSAMVSWVDIAPTLLEATGGVPKKAGLHGRSFLGLIEKESDPAWNEVYASHTFHEITMYYPMRAVRAGRYKLIWNIAHPLPYPFASDLYASKTWQACLARGEEVYAKRPVSAYLQRPRFELYDLEADPDEVKNLAGSAEHQEVLGALQEKLKAFQARTKDPWLLKWEYE